jgi:DNA mismatch endonuclease (patch repair protein)
MDNLTTTERSERMRRVRGSDTKPELIVRQIAHKLGYRYSLHATDVPGKPDLVFRSRMKVVFVHGCFWHRHRGCSNTRTPKSNVRFWKCKFLENEVRDRRNYRKLRSRGWGVMVIWECQIPDVERIKSRIRRFLG